jgi:hypothetical protein
MEQADYQRKLVVMHPLLEQKVQQQHLCLKRSAPSVFHMHAVSICSLKPATRTPYLFIIESLDVVEHGHDSNIGNMVIMGSACTF